MGRDANREEEATWHTQAQRTLLPSFPTPLFLLGIWSALSHLVGCGRREKQVADVRGGVWWALVSSVYALYAPEWPCTRGPTKPNLPWSGLTFGHVTSALCRSCLSFPRTSGIPGFQKNPVVGAHRQVCAPRGGTRKRGHSGGQTKRSKAELPPFAESARKTAPSFLLLVPSLQVSAGASSALSDFFSAAHGVVSCAYRPLNCRLIDLGETEKLGKSRTLYVGERLAQFVLSCRFGK